MFWTSTNHKQNFDPPHNDLNQPKAQTYRRTNYLLPNYLASKKDIGTTKLTEFHQNYWTISPRPLFVHLKLFLEVWVQMIF